MAPTAPAKRPTPATPPASVSRKKGKTVGTLHYSHSKLQLTSSTEAPPPKPTRKNNKKNDKKNDKENNDPEYVPGSDESDASGR
ncbi:hypothetical protein FRC08_002921 [Ceratobasidium sp. 394]|nr:hypothetical protein FRC08_002921 [Ceratobasidium sp. 394]KAG9090569.1 hypothetical protein FS749_000452 [Ceratobasidium sp. UAMH 11750]